MRAILGSLLSLLALLSCSDTTASGPGAPDAVAQVAVRPDTFTLDLGQTRRLVASMYAADGRELTGRQVVWTSDNDSIAAVGPDGTVTAQRSGTASIRATSEGRTGQAMVRVPPVRVSRVVITAARVLTIDEGVTLQLHAEVRSPGDSLLLDRPLNWGSSDAAVALVSADGHVSARATGAARIWASAEQKSDTITVLVRPVYHPVVRLEPLTDGTVSLEIGGARQLGVRMFAADGTEITDRPVNWTSSAPAVASVSATGLVSGRDAGAATVTATVDEASLSIAVDVRSGVTRVELTPGRTDLAVGDTVRFQAVAKAADGRALERPVQWSSSDTTVARVDSLGLVTAIAAGSVHVVATVDGEQAWAPLAVAPWLEHLLELVDGATVPQILWSSTSANGVVTTVTATSGSLRMATTGINSGRYQQEFWVTIQTGSNVPQVGTYGFGGTWSYDHVNGVYTFLSYAGETLTAVRIAGGGFQLLGRLLPDGPAKQYDYSGVR